MRNLHKLNILILPTQFKVCNTSCCLCYRRLNVSSFTVSLSFKRKCMTGFLSLLSLWPINKSRFKLCAKWMTQRIKHLFWYQLTFIDNPNETPFLCARNLWWHICITNNDIEMIRCDFWFSTLGNLSQVFHSKVMRVFCNCWASPLSLSLRLSTNFYFLCEGQSVGELGDAYQIPRLIPISLENAILYVIITLIKWKKQPCGRQ